jgi:phospholipase C
MRVTSRRSIAIATATLTAGASIAAATGAGAATSHHSRQATATPIKHLVVIFQENVSYDHYFGTYPHAKNPAGEPRFAAAKGTPSSNGLTPTLLHHNQNLSNPQRLDRSEAVTCDQDHDYGPEQQAFDHGLMDKFVQDTGSSLNRAQCDLSGGGETPPPGSSTNPDFAVMDYYDGNTVTGLWNYAQHFSMSDNSYGTTFGPSTPGALNLVSGQTHGVTLTAPSTDDAANGTVIGDPDPAFDDCSGSGPLASMAASNKNIGNLLNAKGITWGWFQGGFRPTTPFNPGAGVTKAVCASSHKNVAGTVETDYSPHHNPFEYYASTANPHHLPPTSERMIGRSDQAHHQYDLSDWRTALKDGNLPAVSFLKAARYQDGHAANSDPIDEQHFLVKTINALQASKDWASTAVVIAYDDSDGWYDHQMSPIVNQSQDPANDALTGDGTCGTNTPLAGFQDRCGYGPRLPLLVVSPFSKVNSIDHSITDQSSILRFVEDNWLGGERIGDGSFDSLAGRLNPMFNFRGHAAKLILNPTTGEPVKMH